MIDIPPLVVSILCIMLTCAFAHFLRVLVLRTTARSPMKKLMLNDAIAAAELCGCCFELIIG
jgi:aquaporin related protein